MLLLGRLNESLLLDIILANTVASSQLDFLRMRSFSYSRL
jgi:hypothetical protein